MQIASRSNLIELLNFYNLPKVCVEVGTAEGRYSNEMFSWGLDKLYLVDIWQHIEGMTGCAGFDKEWHDNNYFEVKNRFKNNKEVVLLKGFSKEMSLEVPDKSCGLVYVDADHSFEGCHTDIISWWPKLADGGIMAFHDFMNPTYGVGGAVREFSDANGVTINLLKEDNNIENIGAWIQKL